MIVIQRPRIDHCNLALPDDIGTGSVNETAGVVKITRRINGLIWSTTPYSNLTSRTKGMVPCLSHQCAFVAGIHRAVCCHQAALPDRCWQPARRIAIAPTQVDVFTLPELLALGGVFNLLAHLRAAMAMLRRAACVRRGVAGQRCCRYASRISAAPVATCRRSSTTPRTAKPRSFAVKVRHQRARRSTTTRAKT